MTIASVDDLIAAQLGRRPQFVSKALLGAQPGTGRMYSTWGMPGVPGGSTAVFDTTLNGVVLSSASALVPGQIPFYNAPSGKITRLSRVLFSSYLGGSVAFLCDRLWHNQISITSTSLQSITSPTWPARDVNGATSGVGVYIALEVSAATGSGAPVPTLTYTNSAGTSGRTAVLIQSLAASQIAGVFFIYALQTGDVGVQSVQSVQLSATWNSGTAHLVAFRIIQGMGVPASGNVNDRNGINAGLPKMYDGSVPFFVFMASGNSAITHHYALMNTSVD